MRFTLFNGNTCESQLYFVKIYFVKNCNGNKARDNIQKSSHSDCQTAFHPNIYQCIGVSKKPKLTYL